MRVGTLRTDTTIIMADDEETYDGQYAAFGNLYMPETAGGNLTITNNDRQIRKHWRRQHVGEPAAFAQGHHTGWISLEPQIRWGGTVDAFTPCNQETIAAADAHSKLEVHILHPICSVVNGLW